MPPANGHTAQVAARGTRRCAHTVDPGPRFIKPGTNTPSPGEADRFGTGRVQPRAAPRTGVVELQTVPQVRYTPGMPRAQVG